MAKHAGAKVILVADIDRGGVFASVYGSMMLLDEDEKKQTTLHLVAVVQRLSAAQTPPERSMSIQVILHRLAV